MGVAAEAKRIGAKVPLILQPDKKEHSSPSTKNSSQCELYFQTPTKNVQELAKKEGEESETKLRAATVTSEGTIPAVAGERQDTGRATS